MSRSSLVPRATLLLATLSSILDAAFKALVQLAADVLLKQKTEDAIKGTQSLVVHAAGRGGSLVYT